jgi:hypothetical protein
MLNINGLTMYICIGKYGGFRCVWDYGIRITLGWIGFAIGGFDVDRVFNMLITDINSRDNEQ